MTKVLIKMRLDIKHLRCYISYNHMWLSANITSEMIYI